MSYADIVDGLHVVFGTISEIKTLMVGEPKSLHGDLPTLYTRFESFSDERQGQVWLRSYRSLHRVVIKWQENDQAEQELIAVVDAIPDAVDDDPQLSGAIAKGSASISECQAGWVTIDGIEYRCLDFYSEVLEKT